MSLRKEERLSSKEIREVFSRGKRRRIGPFMIWCLWTGDGERKFAATCKLKNKPKRNLIKRRIKEAIRSLKGRLQPGVRIVVMGDESVEKMEFASIVRYLEEGFKSFGAVRSDCDDNSDRHL